MSTRARDPSHPTWPRVYRPTRGWRLFFGISSALCIAFAIGLGVGTVTDPNDRAPWLGALLSAVMIAFGALVAAVTRHRLLLFEDAIEVRQFPLRPHRVRRDEVVGRRLLPNGPPQTLVLVVGSGARPLKTSLLWERDDVLERWIDSLPDLDAADHARATADLLAWTVLGPTELDRERALRNARRIANALNGAAIAAMLWAGLYPRPYALSIALTAILPVIALGALAFGRGVYSADPDHREVRPTVAWALMFPGFILTLRALFDCSVVDPWALIVPCVATACVLGLVAATFDPVARTGWRALLFAVVLSPYAGGGAVLANEMLDSGEVETFQVEVLAKRRVQARPRAAYLRLGQWGPYQERDYAVSVDMHDRVEVGGVVCARLHPGALGARWYSLVECR